MAGKARLPDNVVRVVTEYSFAHLRAVERALIQADEVPLVGGIPPLPLADLAEQLQRRFHLTQLDLEACAPRWIEANTAYGSAMEAVSMTCPSLDGELAWLIEDADLGQLVQLLGGGAHVALLADRPLKQSFTRFLALEIVGALRALDFPHQLIPQLNSVSQLSGPVLATEVLVRAGGQEARSRLLLTEVFCRSARQAFAPAKPTHLSEEIARQLSTPVHVAVGEVTLSGEEFRKLGVGDFVALDRSSIDPATLEGSVILEAAGKPFARARAQNGQLELQELDHG